MHELNALTLEVPAQDAHFELTVMVRIEQRRFRRELTRTGALAAASIVLLTLVMPQFDITWLGDLPQEKNIAIAAALMVVTILLPRFLRA